MEFVWERVKAVKAVGREPIEKVEHDDDDIDDDKRGNDHGRTIDVGGENQIL